MVENESSFSFPDLSVLQEERKCDPEGFKRRIEDGITKYIRVTRDWQQERARSSQLSPKDRGRIIT